MKEKLQKIADKIVLVAELPFYPLTRFFLERMLRTKEGRRFLYLHSGGVVPLRRLLMFTLDKIFVKEIKNYALPSYGKDYPGYVLDYKYLIATDFFNASIIKNNYSHTLGSIAESIKKYGKDITTIIDFGCGAGVLTRMIADAHKDKKVIGLDMREDTMECNNILAPSIRWDLASKLGSYVQQYGKDNILLVCNGIITFMKQAEVEDLFAKQVKCITWFYYTPVTDPDTLLKSTEPVFSVVGNDTNYNIAAFSKKYGYSFSYHFVRMGDHATNFLSGVSER